MSYTQEAQSSCPLNYLSPPVQHPYQHSPTESSYTASDAYPYNPEYAWGSGSNWCSNALQLASTGQRSECPESLERACGSPSRADSETWTPQTPLITKSEDTSCHGTSGFSIAVGNSASTSGQNRRKAQNRAAQRAFRMRKEKELEDLRAEIERLGRELQEPPALDAITADCVTAMKHLSKALREGGGTVKLTALSPDRRGCPDDYDPREIFVWIPGDNSSSRLLDARYAVSSSDAI